MLRENEHLICTLYSRGPEHLVVYIPPLKMFKADISDSHKLDKGSAEFLRTVLEGSEYSFPNKEQMRYIQANMEQANFWYVNSVGSLQLSSPSRCSIGELFLVRTVKD